MRDIERQIGRLTGKQERAIAALMAAPSIREAAQSSGVSEATLYRWLQDDSFQKTYQQARREATKQSIARLQQVSGKAVEALYTVLESPMRNPAATVSAAKAVLQLSLQAVELEDLAQRVEELEKHLEAQNAIKGKR